MEAKSFASPAAWRARLQKGHAREKEILVRCFKVHTAGRGVTYAQALDEALCFGWIDGVRRSIDEDSFSVRFTPRKPKSYWSAVNIRKAVALLAAGRMKPFGRTALARHDQAPTRKYSFESKPRTFARADLKKIRANAKASAFLDSRPAGFVRTHAFWVMSAVNKATRLRRLETLIGCWERGEAIPPLVRKKS